VPPWLLADAAVEPNHGGTETRFLFKAQNIFDSLSYLLPLTCYYLNPDYLITFKKLNNGRVYVNIQAYGWQNSRIA